MTYFLSLNAYALSNKITYLYILGMSVKLVVKLVKINVQFFLFLCIVLLPSSSLPFAFNHQAMNSLRSQQIH